MAIKTIRVFAEYTSDGYVPMPSQGNIDYGITIGNSFPETQPSSYQTDDPNIDVAVNTMTDFYVWIRTHGSPWNPSYTRVVRVYPDSPSINSVVMNMIVAVGGGGTTISSGGGVNYYLNGGTSQGVLDGSTYYEMSKSPVEGTGVDFFKINTTGFQNIAQFVTDAGDPGLLNIPAGNWPIGFYFSASDNSGNPKFYAEIYKYSAAGVFTLLGTGSATPEVISNGMAIDFYTTNIAIPDTTLVVTDRIAVRIFVNTDGNRTVNLHTQDSHLSTVGTTFTRGLTAINGLIKQVQFIAIGNAGSDAAIVSSDDTHTINLPTASSTKRGLLNGTDWSTFNAKQAALSGDGFVKISGSTISYDNSTYQPLDGDLTAIGALAGTTGILKKTGANTWALDTSAYLVLADTDALYQKLTNLSSDLIASDTKYPSINAVNAGLILKQNKLNGTGLVRMDGITVTYDNNTYLTSTDLSPYQTVANMQSQLLIGDGKYPSSNAVVAAINTRQPLDADLSAIAALAGTSGILKKTAADTWALDTNTYATSDDLLLKQNKLNGTGLVRMDGITLTYDNATYLTSASLAGYQTVANMQDQLLIETGKYPSSNAVVAAINTRQPLDADLTAIAGLTGTSGLLKKTAADTWTLDTTAYITASSLTPYLLSADAVTTYQRKDKMVSNLLASDTEYPNSNAVLAALALKANAANPTFTGDFTISGVTPRLYFVDTDNNPDYTLFTDSGYFYIYNQTAGSTKFSINPDGNTVIGGSLIGSTATFSGNLTVSSGNTTGNGIILADDGDIVDLNDAYCSMRFSYGVRIYSANRGGTPVITLANTGAITANGNITANSFIGNASTSTTASNLTNFTNQSGGRYLTDFNTILSTGFFNGESLPANAPGSNGYAQLIVAKGVDTGLQIYGGHNNDNLWFRGWSGSGSTFTPWRAVLHSGNYSSYALPLSGGTITGGITINGVQNSIIAQNDGNTGLWRGRIISKNATSNVASFLGTYQNIAGVFAHSNALDAWADLYVNTVDGSNGGTVRMPSSVLIAGNQAIHAGNYGSYALPLSGGTMTGSIAMSGNYSTITHPNGRIILSGNLHIDAFNGNTIYLQYYNQGVTLQSYCGYNLNGYNITGAANILASDSVDIGSNSGNNVGAKIYYSSSYYGRIRFYNDGNNGSTIHSFGTSWVGGVSQGYINIDGQNGVNIGGWNDPDFAVVKGGNTTVFRGLNVNNGGTHSATTYFVGNGNTGSVAGIGLNVYSNNGSGAVMAFHRGGYYAVNMGLDADNVFRIGGWSASANRLQLDMSGNLTLAASVNAPSGYVSLSNPWGTANSAFFPNGITTAGGTNWIYGYTYIGNAPSNGSGHEFFTNGNARSTGTYTASAFYESSDSRLKDLLLDDVQIKDIQNLKAKFYIKNGKHEYGYFAQEAESYIPSAVTRNADGYLNLSYREVHTVKIARLEQRVAELEKQLNVA